jgi:hypothetical protein
VAPNEVVIVYKGPKLMTVALEFATQLVQELNVPLRLIENRVIPKPNRLGKPSLRRKRMENNLLRIVKKSAIPIRVNIVLGRNWVIGFRRALQLRSVVLIPIQESRTTHDKRMAAQLRKYGHQVIWLEGD